MKLYLIFIGTTLLATGCATTPVSTSEAKPVPQHRVLSTSLSAPRAGTGEVIVKRDKGIAGSPCSSRVFVDGAAIADLSVGEKVTLHLAIGDHVVGSKPNGLCGGGLSEVSITVKADRIIALRIRYGSNGDYAIQPTAF